MCKIIVEADTWNASGRSRNSKIVSSSVEYDTSDISFNHWMDNSMK